MKNIRQDIKEYSILLLLMLLFGFFYHFDLTKSGFELFPGDCGDALLNVLAADSWGDVFRGETHFRQNRIYYPFPAGRGFTDLSLTLYFLELPWRWLFNADMFTGAAVVYGLLFHFGIASMFYLLRKILHLNFMAAAGGAMLSFYCNACWVKLNHTQFFFMGLLPLLAILVIRYCQYWRNGSFRKRFLCGAGAILTFAWIAYSNFYTAFFAGLAGVIYFVICAILLYRKGELRERIIPQRIWELLLLALWGGVLFAPFLYTYIPLLNSDYERIWTAAQGTLPTPADIVNVGPQNLLWGKLYDLAFPPIHKYVYENYHGLPLFTLGVTLWCCYFFWKRRKEFSPLFAALPATLAVLYILSVKFAHCISLWYFIWKYVPGGSAIRAGGRIYVFMMFPLMVFLWWMIDRFTAKYSSRKQLLFCGILFVILSIDNYNSITIYGWKPAEYEAKIKAIPPPPPEMKCFYLTDSAGGRLEHDNWSRYGLQAWYMARYFKCFSINGYSGNVPAGFLPLDPLSAAYRQEIADWIRKHALSDVYTYDTAADRWRRHRETDSKK
ncbi:MAG: hypothetical protein IJW17_09345 [Lentisphaeria bacterium]|nr:hypothetical protein [Lentisphaeria bacterium]